MSAIQNASSVLAVATCVALLQACAVAPERVALDGADKVLSDVQISNGLSGLKEGDTVKFRAGLLAKFGTITIGRHYDAASGRSCKQILDTSGVQLLSVACQLPTEQWYIRESLNTPVTAIQTISKNTNIKKVLVPAELPKIESKAVVEDSQEPLSYRVENGETLYSFARRTTGSASNWEEIAQYNGITDEFALSVGTALKIPSALQKTGR